MTGSFGRAVVGVAVLLFVAACSDPHGVKIPAKIEAGTPESDALKKAVEKLPDNEKQLLGNYMARTIMGQAFGGAGAPEGITVGQAIEAQKKWAEERARQEAEEKALAEKVKAEAEAARKVMRDAVLVALVEVKFVPSNFRENRISDLFALTVAFENKGTKDIAGVKGYFAINDMFGTTVKNIRLAYDEGIPVGERKMWQGSMDFNQFKAEDKKLASTPLEKLKVSFEPETIIFTDGTSLSSGK